MITATEGFIGSDTSKEVNINSWLAYTVTSLDRIQDGSFSRMIGSLNLNPRSICVGIRGGTLNDLPLTFDKVLELPLKISLSEARNRLMKQFQITGSEVVFFPDDDCWLGENTLSKVQKILADSDFAIGVVDTDGNENSEILGGSNIDLSVALEVSASAAIFCRSKVLEQFRFDERLGLGTQIGSAEDLDLVLYMLSKGAKGKFDKSIRIGHPKKGRGMEYFPGSIAVLRKYSDVWPRAWAFMIRRLAHGVVYTIQGKLPLKSLISAFAIMVRNI
jgi:hypothetical protein